MRAGNSDGSGATRRTSRFTILPALELVLQEVEERFLHHVGHLERNDEWMREAGNVHLAAAASWAPYLKAFERWPHQDDGSHGGNHIVGRDVLHLQQDTVPISSPGSHTQIKEQISNGAHSPREWTDSICLIGCVTMISESRNRSLSRKLSPFLFFTSRHLPNN